MKDFGRKKERKKNKIDKEKERKKEKNFEIYRYSIDGYKK